jgi:DNA ligase-4
MKIKSCRVFTDILKDLFENLSPWEGACMTQIILRDLRPLLYPPPSLSPTFALLHYTGAAYRQITPYDAMKAWDFRMPRIHARCSRLDEAAATLRDLQDGVVLFDDLKSRLGTPISIPRCHKGTSCHQVMEKLHMENDEVFGEIKYDGER